MARVGEYGFGKVHASGHFVIRGPKGAVLVVGRGKITFLHPRLSIQTEKESPMGQVVVEEPTMGQVVVEEPTMGKWRDEGIF